MAPPPRFGCDCASKRSSCRVLKGVFNSHPQAVQQEQGISAGSQSTAGARAEDAQTGPWRGGREEVLLRGKAGKNSSEVFLFPRDPIPAPLALSYTHPMPAEVVHWRELAKMGSKIVAHVLVVAVLVVAEIR